MCTNSEKHNPLKLNMYICALCSYAWIMSENKTNKKYFKKAMFANIQISNAYSVGPYVDFTCLRRQSYFVKQM